MEKTNPHPSNCKANWKTMITYSLSDTWTGQNGVGLVKVRDKKRESEKR